MAFTDHSGWLQRSCMQIQPHPLACTKMRKFQTSAVPFGCKGRTNRGFQGNQSLQVARKTYLVFARCKWSSSHPQITAGHFLCTEVRNREKHCDKSILPTGLPSLLAQAKCRIFCRSLILGADQTILSEMKAVAPGRSLACSVSAQMIKVFAKF